MPTDPLEQARRERSLLRGLYELSLPGQLSSISRSYKQFADRERAGDSLLGSYLTALEPVEQIGSDLVESGQMIGNAIQAGSGALAGVFSPAAYERSVSKRADPAILPEFDPLAMGSYLENAPGPGDVIAETVIPEPKSAIGRVGKTVGALAGNIILDPSNLATGGLGAADDLARSGRYADAAAELLGSPIAGAIYAPDIVAGVTQGADVALDPTQTLSARLEAGAQAGLMTGLGAMVARGVAMDRPGGPMTLTERVALKREAKAQGLDDAPPARPVQPTVATLPQEAPIGALPAREPELLPEPVYEAPGAPEPPPGVVEAARPPDVVAPEPQIEPVVRPPDFGVAPERPEADIALDAPSVPEAAPETPVASPESAPIPFQFPLDEVDESIRPRAEEVGVSMAQRFAGEGRFDQAAFDETMAANPDLAPYADQIKRHAVLEGISLINGRWALDEAQDYHGSGPDGLERVDMGGPENYDIVQRRDGNVVGIANVRDNTLAMVAGGRKMGSPDSIRPVYEAVDEAGAKRSGQLTLLGAKSQATKAARDAAAKSAGGVGPETRPLPALPDAPGARGGEPGEGAGIPGGPGREVGGPTRDTPVGIAPVRPDAGPGYREATPETEGARGPLGGDDPLPIRQVVDTARQRLAQHARTKAPEATIIGDLGGAVYHVLASGAKRTFPQVRGWVKRHLGTWLRKVGLAGERLNRAIQSAYDSASARWSDYRARLADPLSDPAQRGSTSAAHRESKPVVSREEIDRQLRASPELRGMARAQLESIAQSAGKPISRLNTEDIGRALTGTDDQSKASRALLNRMAAYERAHAPVEGDTELTEQLQASLRGPVRTGPKVLNNPRSKSGKVREETPVRPVAQPHVAPTPESTTAVESSISASPLPAATKKRVAREAGATAPAVGHGRIMSLSDLDEGVRAALMLRSESDLRRMLHGRQLTQAEVAAFKLATQEQRLEILKRRKAYEDAKSDAERSTALSSYLDAQLEQAEALRAFAGDSAGAARIAKARGAMKPSDSVATLFAGLRPEARSTISKRDAATLATLMRDTLEGRRPSSDLGAAIQAVLRPTRLDKVLEWWKAGLLSGPPTHVANFVGNTTNLMLDLAKTGVAGGLDALGGKGARSRYVSDLGAAVTGMREALPTALRQFASDMSDLATLKPEKFDLSAGRYEHQVGAIGGTLGRIVRSPFRALGASDGFFRTILTAGEQFKEANRAIEHRIEKGDVDRAEKGEFMADHLDRLRDPANAEQFKDAASRIDKAVRKGLFQQDADEITRYVQRLLHTPVGEMAQFFVPFVSTPVNILKTTVSYTPAGALSAYPRLRSLKPEERAAALDDMAKGLVGTVIGTALVGLASQGVITGSGPSDPRERALKEKTGWKPHSLVLKLGGTTHYVPLDRIEPLGTLFGLAGDVFELGANDSGDSFTRLVGMLKDNVLNKSYAQGLSNMFELASDPERHGPGFLRSFAGSWVPAVVGRLAQGLDPIVRDTRGEGDTPMVRLADSVRKSIQSRIPIASERLPARRDPTGAPMERSGNFVTRALIPSAISEEKTGPEADVARELLRIDVAPYEPRSTMTINGRKIELKDSEYRKLQEAREAASREVGRVMRTPEYKRLPDSVEQGGQASKEAVVRRIYQGYQERARHELYRQPRIERERRKAQANRVPDIRIQYRDR